jgi:23S rRNA (cytosine1962-C5)-methyltransferase
MVSQVVLRREKRGTFFARHPWVLEKSLVSAPGDLTDGQPVDLVLPDGRWVARGIFNSRSRIRVRLYSWNPDQGLDERLWHDRLERAVALREELGLLGAHQAARLVFSEGDGLSGLIVDRYGPYLVIQLTALAVQQQLSTIRDWLLQRLDPRGIIVRSDPRTAKAEGMEPQEDWIHGQPPQEPLQIEEHGVRLTIDLREGQKTGYYLDQRDNRLEAAKRVDGRQVLDICCYVGGFALAAARHGRPLHVLGIDSSRRAVEQAAQHARDNGLENVEFQVGDCFEALQQFRAQGRRFGTIILDPPRFAGSRRSIDQALRAYHRLNRLAVDCLEPNGYLITCSCSGLVTREDFRHMLSGVSQRTGRDVQILQQRGAAPDHPVWITCPETEYLKCFVCRVL